MPKVIHARGSLAIAKYAAAVLVIAILSALQAPYQYGNGNQVFQIPKVHLLMNPHLYPDDAFVDTLRDNYPSVVYPGIAALTSVLGSDVETVYFALWICQRIALVAVILLIASRFIGDFSGRVFVTLVACTALWAIRRTPIGGENLFSARITHTELAFVLQAGALTAWVHRREVFAGALIGAAAYFNVMTTVHAAGFLALLWLLVDDRFSRRYLLAALAMVVVAAPFTISLSQAMTGAAGAAGATDRFWELLRIRAGSHYFLGTLHFASLASITLVLGLLARMRKPDPALRRMMLAGVIYVAAMFIVSFFGVHLSSSKLVVLFHPLRGDKMLLLTFVLAVPILVWKHATTDAAAGAGRMLLPAIIAVFMMGYTPPAVALSALPALVALAVLVGDRTTVFGLDARYVVLGATGLAALALLALPNATLYATALLVGVAAGALLGAWQRPRWVFSGVVALLAVGLMARSTGLASGQFEWYRAGEDRQFVAAAEWAEDATAARARFITPTWMEGWRSLSRRSTLAQYRDLSAMHYYVGFEGPLWERLEAVNGAVYFSDKLASQLCEGYLALHPADLAEASERFDIDYVVMPAEWPHGEGLMPVYANEGYEVFASTELQHAATTERGED